MAIATAPHADGEGGGSAIGPRLPPGVRALLIEEMNAVLGASREILDALVRGRDEIVAERAQAIHDSFILAQRMTPADRRALRDAAPEAFLERDRAFHDLARRLADAARAKDRPRQRALFAELVDACAGCHARFARDRFAGFAD